MVRKSDVVEGSDNIFADLGLPDAEEHLLKAKLVSRIYDVVKQRKLTQTDAGKILGISQSRVSQMLNGHFREFSVEKLMRFLNALDQDVEIRIKTKPRRASRPARLDVRAA